MAARGSSLDASQAVYYAASQLYTPDDLSSYGSDEYNNLTDPLDAAGMNHWTTIDLGTTILVARKIDPFKTYTVDELNSMYDLLTSMKSDAIQDELYAAGAALEHNLNSSALNTYSASKIKERLNLKIQPGAALFAPGLFEGPHDENKYTNLLLQTLGCFISAAGIYSFAVAAEVPVTGVAGICAILYRLFGIPMGLSNVLINIPIILCTYKLLGKSFFIRSVYCMVLFAIFTDYLLPLMPVYQGTACWPQSAASWWAASATH